MQGLVFVYALAMSGMLIYLLWLGVLKLNFDWKNFPKGFRTAFIQFSLVTFLATAASTLIMKIDSIMVSSMVSLEANAIYAIAFSMALVIEMPRRAISQVVMPVIADHFAKKNHSEIDQIYKQVSNRQLFICLLLFAGIWSNIDVLYVFIPNGTLYQAGKWVVLLIGIGKLLDVAFSVNSEILVFSTYYRFNLLATIGMSILIVLLNYWLIPIYGIEGAALASVLVMLLYNLAKYIFLKVKLGFSPFSTETIKIIVVGLATMGIAHFKIIDLNPIVRLLSTSLEVLLLYVFFSYLLKTGREEWNWIRKKIKKSGP
jgi:O-antigen/teichoic acid export membrane protein